MSRKKVAMVMLLKPRLTFLDHLIVFLSLFVGNKKKRGEKRG
jgi:hypothetical protein